MADMSLDELLSSSIKSAAEPAASKGVADAIRARVAAGDTGTAVAGSTAPGWGGGATSLLTIVAPVALIVVAGVVGGVLGATGVFGAPAQPGGELPGYLTTTNVATGYTCPGGPISGTIPAGTRVLAVARDDKGEYLGVRNPGDRSDVMFFATDDLVLDAGGIDPATLPVVACPVATVTIVTPEPEAPTEEPTTPPNNGNNNPPPPPDTTAPTIGKATVAPNPIGSCAPAQSAIVSVTAADNVGVAGVTVSWNGTIAGSAQMSPAGGGAWKYTFTPPNGANGLVTFSTQARDAAGNLSGVATTSPLSYNCIG